jgi:hypothetical protein
MQDIVCQLTDRPVPERKLAAICSLQCIQFVYLVASPQLADLNGSDRNELCTERYSTDISGTSLRSQPFDHQNCVRSSILQSNGTTRWPALMTLASPHLFDNPLVHVCGPMTSHSLPALSSNRTSPDSKRRRARVDDRRRHRTGVQRRNIPTSNRYPRSHSIHSLF